MPLAVMVDMPLKDFCEGVIYIEGSFVAYVGVYHSLVQFSRNLICLLTQAACVGAHLVAVEVDGGYLLQIALVADLITFGIEFIANTCTRVQILGSTNLSHVAEDACNLLALGVETCLTVEVDIHCLLGCPDGIA